MIGAGAGAAIAQSQNGDPRVQRGDKSRTSTTKSMVLGGAIGFVLDVGLIALFIRDESSSFGHSFGH